MKPFTEIAWKAPNLVCPDCGTCSMSVILRCDATDRECLTVASCTLCGKQYDADVLPTYQERYEALLQIAKAEACPLCGAYDRIVRSLCDRTAKECFLLLACSGCGDVRLS